MNSTPLSNCLFVRRRRPSPGASTVVEESDGKARAQVGHLLSDNQRVAQRQLSFQGAGCCSEGNSDCPVNRGRHRISAMASRCLARAVVGLLFAASPSAALALDPDKSFFQFNCQTWTRQDGLPASGISAVTQTPDGFLWLGTQRGLVRFDGVEFVHVPMPRTALFQRQAITSLSVDGEGGVWFGILNGAFGVYRHDTGFDALENQEWVEPAMTVSKLLFARDGSLWVGFSGYVAQWTAGADDAQLFEFPHAECLAIFEDSGGRIWLSVLGQGVFYFDGAEMIPFSEPALTEEGTIIFAIAEDRDGNFWFGTQSGVRVFDRDLRPVDGPEIYPKIVSILPDREGTVWVGSDGYGLFRWRNGEVANYRQADGLASDQVTALHQDHEGNMWVGTRGGLNLFTDLKIPLYAPEGEERRAAFHSVSAAAGGGVWAGSSIGLFRFDGERFTLYDMEDGLSSTWLKQVFEASDGDLYIANGAQQVEVFREGKVVARHQCENWPTGFAEDEHGVVMGVAGRLYRVNSTGMTPYEFTRWPPEMGWIRSLNSARDGTILVASVQGVFLVKDGEWKQFGMDEGLPFEVLWVCEDSPDLLWAGLAGGVARIEGDRVDIWTQDDGLFDNYIRSIVPDDDGWLWFHSSSGIFRVHRDTFMEGGRRATQLTYEVFDGPEFVKTLETGDAELSAFRTTDGRIWIPSPEGLLAIDPARLEPEGDLPRAHIERVRINGQEQASARGFVVPPGRGELEIHYTAPTFIAPREQQFRYKLEGYDQDWQEVGTRRSAFYTNLKPGHYRFLVEAYSADGPYAGGSDTFEVEFLPFFYQTSWFYLLCLALGLSVPAGAYSWRVAFLKRKQHQLQEIRERLETEVRHRTAELKERTLRLESEIDERKQMEREVERANRELLQVSRLAGMAEVATGVLHNAGNVLNSANISAEILTQRLRRSKTPGLQRVALLFKEHQDNIAEFLSSPKGQMLPGYIEGLSGTLVAEQAEALQELGGLKKNIEHLKEIVAMQQNYATVAGVTTHENPIELIEDALRINEAALEGLQVSLVRQFEETLPPVLVDRHKVIQILVNLIRNAKHACEDCDREGQQIIIRAVRGEGQITISVIDNGVGISPENFQRIFNYGFTTRATGRGFGLHSGALAAKELGGALHAASDGPGNGATFTLTLPLANGPAELLSAKHSDST